MHFLNPRETLTQISIDRTKIMVADFTKENELFKPKYERKPCASSEEHQSRRKKKIYGSGSSTESEKQRSPVSATLPSPSVLLQ